MARYNIMKKSLLSKSYFLTLSIFLVAILSWINKATSQELNSDNVHGLDAFMRNWSNDGYMTGNWGGIRDKLSLKGINFSGFFAASILGNPAGGEKKGILYTGLLNLYLDLDLEKLIHLKGSSVRISGSWASGQSLSEDDIGNLFEVSSIFSGQKVRLYQLYLEQSLFNERVDIAIGRLATGDDFLTSPLFYNFVSLAFDQNPISIFFNIPSFTVDPFATWGARSKVRVYEDIYFKMGAYVSNRNSGKNRADSLDFTLSDGALLIGEVVYHYGKNKKNSSYPGVYKIGGYYDTQDFEELSNPLQEKNGNFGLYLIAEQMIYSEGNKVIEQGLIPFITLTIAPTSEINPIPFFFSTGLVYQGLFSGRDEDTTSFGLAYGNFSRDLAGRDFEMVMEITHNFVITPWLNVQPDFQYIVHPGGDDDIPNAFVLGFEFLVNL